MRSTLADAATMMFFSLFSYSGDDVVSTVYVLLSEE